MFCEKCEEYPAYLDSSRNVLVWVDWLHQDRGINKDEEEEKKKNSSSIVKLLGFLSTLKKVQRVKILLNHQKKNKTEEVEARVVFSEHHSTAVGDSSSSKIKLVEMMQKGLDLIPRLQEYRVVDRFSPVLCCREVSWRDEGSMYCDRSLRGVLGDDMLK